VRPVAVGFIGSVIRLSLVLRKWSRNFKSPMRRNQWESLVVLGALLVCFAIYDIVRGNT
jgi:hypothetical protein